MSFDERQVKAVSFCVIIPKEIVPFVVARFPADVSDARDVGPTFPPQSDALPRPRREKGIFPHGVSGVQFTVIPYSLFESHKVSQRRVALTHVVVKFLCD